MFNIKFKTIAISAYIYIVLPIIIFFLTWLKWYIGIPMSIILIMGLVVLLKKNYMNNCKKINISVKSLLGICLFLLIWNWLSGQGGFFYQTWDNHYRNAILNDLINYSWPVIYPETGNALVYYLMHWIVPAIFGKIFGNLGGRIALFVWTYIGLIIIYLLLVHIIKADTKNKLWTVAIVFVIWGGLDNIGWSIMDVFGQHNYVLGSGEGWLDLVTGQYPYAYQYSSNNTLLSWVYNQAIVPWMIVLLFLENRNVQIFAFLGLIMLPYGPIPFIGFVAILIIYAVPIYINKIKTKQYFEMIKETFSIENVSAILTVFPIFLMFYKCNENVGEDMSFLGFYVPLSEYGLKRILILVLFYVLEFGIYSCIVYKKYKNDKLYYIINVSLILIPIFRIGTGRDFCMRGSVPALLILMIMVLKYIFDTNYKNKAIITIVLTIAALNPFMDYASRCNEMYDAKKFPMAANDIPTFADKDVLDKETPFMFNFLTSNPKEKLFYKYIAKK